MRLVGIVLVLERQQKYSAPLSRRPHSKAEYCMRSSIAAFKLRYTVKWRRA